MTSITHDPTRARGALLGLAVGDSCGATLEFKRSPEAPWLPLLTGPHTNVIGGGPFNVLPGQVTDDTMMAVCLAISLQKCGGLDLEDVSQRYVAWRRVTFDCGSQTGQSLTAITSGSSAEVSGKEVWERGGRKAAGNGSLMRTAPIGVFFASSPIDCVTASVLDSNITHFDPRCALACAAYNAAIGAAIGGASTSGMVQAAMKGLHMGAGFFLGLHLDLSETIAAAVQDLEGDLGLAEDDYNPGLYSPELHIHSMQGFVRVAFRLAFWELHHAPDFRSGLVDCVNRLGDSDTNGAITGGLLGARYGDSAIPEEWKTTVLNCDPPAPFNKAGALHPARLLEMLEEEVRPS